MRGEAPETPNPSEPDLLGVPPSVWKLVPERLLRRRGVFPVAAEGLPPRRRIVVAMPDPTNLEVMDEIAFATGLVVKPVTASATAIRRAIAIHFDGEKASAPAAMHRPPPPEAAPAPAEQRGGAIAPQRLQDWITPVAPSDTQWRRFHTRDVVPAGSPRRGSGPAGEE
jgi:hypothetical protein